MDVMKEFKSAGLLSKKLCERVVSGTEQAPPAVNPAAGQTDVNISGHSTAPNPLADQTTAPAAAPATPAGKTQKEYLMNACKSALGAVESCMESICEGKCFETSQMDQQAMTEMQGMYNMVKEWKTKMESWTQPAAAPAAPTAPAAPAQTPPPQAAPAAPEQTTSVQAPPSPITGSAV